MFPLQGSPAYRVPHAERAATPWPNRTDHISFRVFLITSVLLALHSSMLAQDDVLAQDDCFRSSHYCIRHNPCRRPRDQGYAVDRPARKSAVPDDAGHLEAISPNLSIMDVRPNSQTITRMRSPRLHRGSAETIARALPSRAQHAKMNTTKQGVLGCVSGR